MKKGFIVALVISLVFLALSGTKALANTYTTSFPLTENPIVEGGQWINGKTTGIDWADVLTTNGVAIGTETGSGGYDDSTALLTGTWGPNQTVAAIVYLAARHNSNYPEVECRLRSQIAGHVNSGYEVTFSLRDSSPYAAIVRWNGPIGQFTVLASIAVPVINNGDEVKATITNQTITAYLNGAPVLQVTDNTYSSGSPGMGFYRDAVGDIDRDYGFTSFTATDGLGYPPAIDSQPRDQAVDFSSNATFAVTATGAVPLFYQWYFNSTNVLAGATNSQLILTNVGDADAGRYSVWVSNSVGSVMSHSAQLVINHLPVIESQPQTQVVNLASNAAFAVMATGATPLFYQWYFNGTNVIAGATNSQLILTNVLDSDAGWYSTTVSNSLGSVLSDSAQLVVNHSPVPASPTLERYWDSGFRVQETLLLGTDPDGEPVVLITVETPSVQGGTVSTSEGSVLYMPPPGLTNDDSFNYTVSDGRGGFAVGTAMIIMLTNQGPSLSVVLGSGEDRSVRVVGRGIANRLYALEFAEDLGNPNWQPIGSVMSDDFGGFEYVDHPSLGDAGRFYRLSTCCAEAKSKTTASRLPAIEKPSSWGGR